jgi:hypothetical protein
MHLAGLVAIGFMSFLATTAVIVAIDIALLGVLPGLLSPELTILATFTLRFALMVAVGLCAVLGRHSFNRLQGAGILGALAATVLLCAPLISFVVQNLWLLVQPG